MSLEPLKTDLEKLAALDDMSRDMLLLTRTVGIYPQGHPQISALVKRLTHWAHSSGDQGVSVGVTGSELIVDGMFYGGKETRIEILARQLNSRKVARLSWSAEVDDAEVYHFARLLANRDINGEDLAKALEEAGIEHIGLVALDLEALHGRMQLEDTTDDHSDEERRKHLWIWLQEISGNPKEIGRTISSDKFWATMDAEDPGARAGLTEVLAGLGTMIDRAVQTLPEDVRAKICDQLSRLGRELPPSELAKLLDVYLVGKSPTDQALRALMRHVQGERLAGVLGGLVTLGGAKEERVAAFVKRFIPADSILGLVGLMRDWQAGGEKMGIAAEVWRWLESFLLDMDENEYMGDGYRETLDRMAMRLRTAGESGAAFGFFEDPQVHLDLLCAGIAREKVEEGPELLTERINVRMDELDGVGALEFLEMIYATYPVALAGRPEVFEKLFREASGGVKDFSAEVRRRFIEFARLHEQESLDVILKYLAEEQRISVRRFMVEVLCHFSSASLPSLVRYAKNSPWFVIRNIVIVFGRIGDGRAMPYLRSLLEHENPKVRKEAIRSLSLMGERARNDLIAYGLRGDRPMDERKLAQTAADRIKVS